MKAINEIEEKLEFQDVCLKIAIDQKSEVLITEHQEQIGLLIQEQHAHENAIVEIRSQMSAGSPENNKPLHMNELPTDAKIIPMNEASSPIPDAKPSSGNGFLKTIQNALSSFADKVKNAVTVFRDSVRKDSKSEETLQKDVDTTPKMK